MQRLRARISRSEWAIRHFGFLNSKDAANRPGLVLIQIDGLSHTQMQRAMDGGRLPFLRSLIETEAYRAERMYSGLPSSTPAVQAELFYGVQQAVPAFCYYDKRCGRIFSMFEGDDAREIQTRLSGTGQPLLKNGSAYCDTYSGGTEEAHLCMTGFGWPDILRPASPPMVGFLSLLHIPSLLRISFLLVVELAVALVDLFRGLISKQDLRAELKFVPSRVAVCIVMREIVVMRSGIDLMRGLPIVHMNFLGYDEQSHRRGPDSAFAHWSLKGIDQAIRRVYKAAQRSMRRDYDVWVYSDHGQTSVDSYQAVTGRTIHEAVSCVFDQTFSACHKLEHGSQFKRARMLHPKRHRPESQPPDRLPIVTTLGPIGYIYLGTPFSDNERDTMAERLVHEASIPLVITPNGDHQATAWTEAGHFSLPRDATVVLGHDHPFLEETARDLVALCHHQDAGDFLISGWTTKRRSLSFAAENGSHGGPSPEETGAFAIIPEDAPLPNLEDHAMRPADIRHAALTFLAGRDPIMELRKATAYPIPMPIRVLTYNIHNCAGMDGSVSPHRIARVIERENPDIIALQEVDVNRERTQSQDQAQLLAHYLSMHYYFHPAVSVATEQYGDAILSRFPMTLHRADALPYRKHWLVDEARGALWVEFDLGHGRRLQLINTHFGLGRRERREQAEALLGPGWLGHSNCQDAVILCGDFNSSLESEAHRLLCSRLKNVQNELQGHTPLKTFLGRHPFGYIDHVLINERIETVAVRVPYTQLTRMASDHLPLVVDFKIVDE